MASSTDNLQARTTIRFQQGLLIFRYSFALPAIDELRSGGESRVQNSGANIIDKMVNELADRVEGLAAMRTARRNYTVELILERVQVMLAEFGLCSLQD